jgi:RNA polymerase sigma-70 factor, ECF subfamily
MNTITNTDLLVGLKDRNNDSVWQDFFSRYQPMLVAFAKRLGLREDDAQDAAQEALMAFVSAYREGGYDRDKGRLRTWLFGIASHKIRDLQRKRRGKEIMIVDNPDTTGFFNKVPDDQEVSGVWDAEWQKAMLRQCMEEVRKQVKPNTMKAFELFAVQGLPAEKVAEQLGITENAVWIAKNRVLSRLREVQKFMEENW